MKAPKVYHVVPHLEVFWKVQREGAKRAATVSDSKPDAVSVARRLARRAEGARVIVHRRGGGIQTELTFGDA